MYFVLQQTDVSDSLVWNPIDSQVLCPIHKYFNIAPCMFRPNPEELDIQIISMLYFIIICGYSKVNL